MISLSGIICAVCKQPAPRRSPNQKYCATCSDVKGRERGRRWAKENPQSPDYVLQRNREKRSRTIENGAALNRQIVGGIAEVIRPVELAWLVRIAVPFDWAASKNHIYTLAGSHVAMRAQSASYRDLIGYQLRSALGGQVVKNNKVWLDIFIQKPNQRGDAVNFVDLICDAVKGVIAVDDRWFSIRRLDWEISKTNPMIFIGVGQEDVEDAQICSACGRALPLADFTKNAHAKRGVSRHCRDCQSKHGKVAA